MNTPRTTPETDAESINGAHHTQFGLSDFTRKLERERDKARRSAEVNRLCGDAVVAMCKRQESEIAAMREAIKEAHEALDWATSNMNPPFAWEPFKKANAALTKLKPFIAP